MADPLMDKKAVAKATNEDGEGAASSDEAVVAEGEDVIESVDDLGDDEDEEIVDDLVDEDEEDQEF